MVTSKEFKNEVQFWARELGVQPKEVHIRSDMTRKWGSCSTKGRLSFAKDLLMESEIDRREVIIHELLHLRYPDHGKLFKVTLNAYLNKSRENNDG